MNLFRNLNTLKILCVVLSILVLILGGTLTLAIVNNPIKESFLKNIIESKYYKSIPSNEEYEIGKLKGVVGALEDPYSSYLSKKEYLQFNNDLNRQYEGVGIEFDFETVSKITVKKTLPNSPANKADIIMGDELISIDGKLVKDLDAKSIIDKIRGPKNSQVKLGFKRGEETTQKELTRLKIEVELIELTKKDNTAIIKIVSFGEGLDKKMTNIAKDILNDSNLNRIVIDVRSDGGGLLQESVQVISYFLDKDKIIVSEKTKNTQTSINSIDKGALSLVKYPLTILTDRGTASASEILVGALQDHRETPTIGQKTYGKGVVQEIIELPNGDSLKITTAEWLTPKGRRIDKEGIKPTREVDPKTDSLQIALETQF